MSVTEETFRVYDQVASSRSRKRPRVLPGAHLSYEALSLLGSMWDVHWFMFQHTLKEPLVREAMKQRSPGSLNTGSGALFPG